MPSNGGSAVAQPVAISVIFGKIGNADIVQVYAIMWPRFKLYLM